MYCKRFMILMTSDSRQSKCNCNELNNELATQMFNSTLKYLILFPQKKYFISVKRIATNYNYLPERIATNYNYLPERIATNYNYLYERIVTNYNYLHERIVTNYNYLPERIATN